MLLGIWGPSAVGKTTWLMAIMDEIADIVAKAGLVVVTADNDMEYHLNGASWCTRRGGGKAGRWKGKKDYKLSFIDEMIADDKLWIVESSRFFSGMHEAIVDGYEEHGNVAFLFTVTSGNIMQQFLRDRCEVKNKKFRDDYWTFKRADYESRRMINAASNYYIPAGIPCFPFYIDYKRTAWEYITDWLLDVVEAMVGDGEFLEPINGGPTIVQIKGSNGSGKTTIVKQLIASSKDVWEMECEGDVVATVMDDLGWAAIGQYLPHKRGGGCDTLNTVYAIKDAIAITMDELPDYSIVFEGMMISTIISTFYDHLMGMNGIRPLFVVLNASPDGCLSRISTRQIGGRSAMKSDQGVRDKCRQILAHVARYDPRYVRYINVEHTPEDAMLAEFLSVVDG